MDNEKNKPVRLNPSLGIKIARAINLIVVVLSVMCFLSALICAKYDVNQLASMGKHPYFPSRVLDLATTVGLGCAVLLITPWRCLFGWPLWFGLIASGGAVLTLAMR